MTAGTERAIMEAAGVLVGRANHFWSRGQRFACVVELRMGKAEIIHELAHLNAEELAEVRARLDQLARAGLGGNNGQRSTTTLPANPNARSPHLVNRDQIRDFVKQVTELGPNA